MAIGSATLVVAGVVLVIVGVTGSNRPEAPVALDRPGPVTTASTPPPTRMAGTARQPHRRREPVASTTVAPTTAPQTVPPTAPPTTLAADTPSVSIPSIGVRASIVAEGIDQTPGDVGNLAVPTTAEQVGWWDGGPQPGQGGVAVIAGHRVEHWAFWDLPSLHAGDAIDVVGTDHHTTHWVVSDIQQLLKSQLPDSIWTAGGKPQLALVTCGGLFDSASGHYDDNVIIWATPAPPPA